MTVTLHAGDNRVTLRRLIDEGVRVHSVVCDPPYGLVSVQKRFGKEGAKAARSDKNDGSFTRLGGGFMGKKWDATEIERDPEFWRLIHDILEPGGYVFAFSGSRTGHWQACAMEMAGFIMHPMHAWVFGCLDEQTLAATPDGDKPYTDLKLGDEVICYDPASGEYSVQPIMDVVEYDYNDIAYRLIGDHGEQVVSRNHRCIVERNGGEVFQFAETLEREANVPFLEDMRGLREALSLRGPETNPPANMRYGLLGEAAVGLPQPGSDADREAGRGDDQMRRVRGADVEAGSLAEADSAADVQHEMQRSTSGRGLESACPQGACGLDGRESPHIPGEDVRPSKPSVEGRGDTPQSKGQSRAPADQVRSLPDAFVFDGAGGRLCDGAPATGGGSDGSPDHPGGSGASCQSRCDGQLDNEPDAVCQQSGSQTVRTWQGHKTDLVRVVPFRYVGKVWCLRVPTGAFVAVRNGVAFPTGNSGFPKAHAADKAIDATLLRGSARTTDIRQMQMGNDYEPSGRGRVNFDHGGGSVMNGATGRYIPQTPEAAEWAGWAYGTQAQKPALEPIYLGQKPFSEKTGAANLLKHGVGAVNIDGCRVPSEMGRPLVVSDRRSGNNTYSDGLQGSKAVAGGTDLGRHPSNLILDGSAEVVALFPDSKGQLAKASTSDTKRAGQNVYGEMVRGSNGMEPRGDSGSAARFFHHFPPDADPLIYHPKAGRVDRAGSTHPTVKPIALMRYLVRHVTRPGGTVLDPFAGSGTTAEAARLEGCNCILMEAEPEYVEFLERRFPDAAAGGVSSVSVMAHDNIEPMGIFG